MEKETLLEALNHIDPQRLSYQDWVNVGFGLHEEGLPADVWDAWSQKDPGRYHPGECQKKWRTFRGTASPVTGATILQYAMEQGFVPANSGRGLDWEDEIGGPQEMRFIRQEWLEDQELPPPPKDMNGPKQLIRYLSLLFEASENVGYVTKSYQAEDGKKVPTKGLCDRTAGQLIKELNNCGGDIGKVIGDWDGDAGAWIRFNPLDGKGVKNENVTEYRYALVESDTLPLEKQYALLLELKLPIVLMVHSGKKSIHAIVRIDAQDYDEYRKRVDYLYKVCQENGMQLDRQNRNPSRLSRMPGILRDGNPQYIIRENVGCDSFPEWQEYIASIHDDLPDMENLSDLIDNLPNLSPELIQGVLRMGHKLLLSGPSKAGKSFALIELSIAIAEGVPWMGLPCQKGGVLYVNLELDRASCLHRFHDVYAAMGIQGNNASNIDIWNLRGKSVPMDKLAPKLIRRALKKRYQAVIIDPIYKVITGDENSADQMAAFCNQFDKICTELGCAVIYCHHHSKGSQGQKRSMDRASGSGVFARDPDALIDLIELDISPIVREGMIHREERDTMADFLHRVFPHDLEDRVSQDELCSHVALKAACERLLPDDVKEALAGALEAARGRARGQTAWRIEGTLREFAPMKPLYLWFDYPIHRADELGTLKDMTADGERRPRAKDATKARKEQAKETNKTLQEELQDAFANANAGGPVTVKTMAEYLGGRKENTLRKQLTKFGYCINKTDNTVHLCDCERCPVGVQDPKTCPVLLARTKAIGE